MRFSYLICLLALGCGDDGGGKMDAAVNPDTRPIDSSVAQMDGPAGTAPLTMKNYLQWCSVSVNGGAASAAAMQVVNVAPGTISLVATAVTGFKLDATMWHHTDGDTGGGEAGTVASMASTAMVTVGATAKCVWVCCPFLNGTGCTGLADQCL